MAGGLERAGYDPLLSGVSSSEEVHEASAMEMVAPESTEVPAALVASMGRRPMGSTTVGEDGLVLNSAPGVVDADAEAVVSSEAQ